MRIRGRIWKDGSWWLADIPTLDIMTQGRTRREAAEMIVDAVEGHVNRDGFRVELYLDKNGDFEIRAEDAAGLTALYLKRRRQASGMTLAEVAERLGVKSHNAYARYEQGKAVPTIQKLAQLLSIVDGESDITLGRSRIRSGPITGESIKKSAVTETEVFVGD